MSDLTPLDEAYMAMETASEDDRLRLAFYGRLLEGVLFLLLEADPEGETIEPRLFPLDDGPYVLAFDTEERLAEFAAGPAPYAAVPGARVAALLSGQTIGLGLNLGGAASQMLLPPEAVEWLAKMAAEAPTPQSDHVSTIAAPTTLPEPVLVALDRALARAGGLAGAAYLCSVTYEDGRAGHLVAIVDALPDAQPALAQAVQGALTFSGVEDFGVDVVFVAQTDALVGRLAQWGVRFDLPERAQEPTPVAPGQDPDRPPRLR